MPPESATPPREPPSHFKNWLSLAGAIIALGSLFAFVFLVAIDTFAHNGNPYLGILTYLILPMLLIFGLVLIPIGVWRKRKIDTAIESGG